MSSYKPRRHTRRLLNGIPGTSYLLANVSQLPEGLDQHVALTRAVRWTEAIHELTGAELNKALESGWLARSCQIRHDEAHAELCTLKALLAGYRFGRGI